MNPVLQAETAAPGLPAHERQRRREAPAREARVRISSLELVGGRAVGGDEEGEAFVEDLAHRLARRVEERGRRLLHPLGTGPGRKGARRLDSPDPLYHGGVSFLAGFPGQSSLAGRLCRLQIISTLLRVPPPISPI